MKKKLLCLLLLFSLLFAVGCSTGDDKEDSDSKSKKDKVTESIEPEDTPTPTPTPTPLPQNLAKANLEKLSESLEAMLAAQTESTVDFSEGVGCDFSLEITLGDEIIELLEATGLESISASGSLDLKDALATNLGLYLNDSEIVNGHLFVDAENILFNLPKYSSNYAAIPLEEIFGSMMGEDIEWSEDGSSITGSTNAVIPTLNTVDTAELPSGEEVLEMLQTHLTSFVDCFKETGDAEKNVTIGTGEYTLTGEKHTVTASVTDMSAVLESLEEDLQEYGEVDFGLEDITPEEGLSFVLEYYVDENGNYAWAGYPSDEAGQPLVFIHTDYGFCLYFTEEDGTIETYFSSVTTKEGEGIITIGSGDSVAGTVEYEIDDNSFSMEADIDTLELDLEYSMVGETIEYEMTLVSEGVSFVISETTNGKHTEIAFTMASYGVEYVTLTMTTDLRDYAEIPAPQNTVDVETWASGLDAEAFSNDLLQLIEDYPFLSDIGFGGEEAPDDDWGDDWSDDWSDDEPFVIPEDYTDDFMGMTGYEMDSDGYVDFDPLESEVLAIGKPSTGLDTMAITEAQKQAMFDVAGAAFSSGTVDEYNDYWVWGKESDYGHVESYYTTTYSFEDASSWSHYIDFTFDAVSGEFSSVSIYAESEAEALRLINEFFTILGGNYTLTKEIVEDYSYDEDLGLNFSGYDGAKYGSDYYHAEISVFSWDW